MSSSSGGLLPSNHWLRNHMVEFGYSFQNLKIFKRDTYPLTGASFSSLRLGVVLYTIKLLILRHVNNDSNLRT